MQAEYNHNKMQAGHQSEPQIIHIPETNSTNHLIRSMADAEHLPSGSIVLADFQTAGRGLSGNSWESEAGKNLTFSVLYYPVDVPAGRPFVVSEMVALSVKNTLDKYLTDVSVKWPNDVYYRDGKIAGILIENILFQGKISQSIIGIGLNVNQTVFRSDAPNPISMAQISGKEYNRMAIMDDFRQAFAVQSKRLNEGHLDAIHLDYINTLYHKNGYHRYHDAQGAFEATIHDIEPTGHLALERTDGTISRYAFKEINYLIKLNPTFV
jgi:BirA family biotin operon repressor/biotin-[acetyl-CoA-carboxylase] ligase